MEIVTELMRERVESHITERLNESYLSSYLAMANFPRIKFFDCGHLGAVVVRFDYCYSNQMVFTFEWLSWSDCHTLNATGLDLP